MLVEVSKVKVTDRIRKDFGNIEELANDIKENGLINPPVVTPDFELIAGERRLRACKHLGYDQIEVRVMTVKDEEHQLKLEISENENRKEFTFSERVDWAKRLERVESIKARERMVNPMQNSSQGKTREIVAEKSGFGSHDTFNKAKFIDEHADDDIIQKLNEEKISIHKAWVETKNKLESIQKEKEGLESELQNRPVVEKERTIEVEVYPKDYHQIKNELELLKYKIKEQKNNNATPKEIGNNLANDFYTKFKFRLEDFVSALNDCSILINPFIFMDNYYKKMEQKHRDFLLKEVSQLEEDIKSLKNQIKYQGGIINE